MYLIAECDGRVVRLESKSSSAGALDGVSQKHVLRSGELEGQNLKGSKHAIVQNDNVFCKEVDTGNKL